MQNPAEQEFLKRIQSEHGRMTFFVSALVEPRIHWFFHEGQKALRSNLYLPGVTALLNGIEASVRVTVAQMETKPERDVEVSPYNVLSNQLLLQARDAGMPIDSLKFPGEDDFEERLASKSKPQRAVRLVQLRNDVCHGNILAFVRMTDDPGVSILTPECLRETAQDLLEVSFEWVFQLAQFRMAHQLRSTSKPIPDKPSP